ncbi:MAG: nitrile hydratase subunit beta [SAR202 cluster bacterium]|jgi:hypothetical protein|nr:MAG: nitrile hydratase subunit beta [SAR202 cluster bacterium]GIS81777.1 MAG: hypothetical protein CM1200mP15_04090 [Dehalococcoidia bacterium]|tara:strand:+ start:496 stop:789 length:294 start_codon:yes stop_codon:yes gene_type:complete
MRGVHDRGGLPDDTPINMDEHEMMDWELRVDAMHAVLGNKGLRSTDQMRRVIESIPKDQYEHMTYYERWTHALEVLVTENELLSVPEIDEKMSDTPS